MDNSQIAFIKQRAREHLLSFCVYSDKFFEINKHHEIIADALQRFMEGKVKKLILQTPPRSGKSRLICEAIAWAFGNIQNTDIIYTGHSISLLESFSRNIRDRVASPEYRSIFKDTVKGDNGAVGAWSMTNNNQLMIYGVGGGITGKGGHRLIIDDPYATRQDAESDTIRKRVEDWYDSTFLSRRHNSEAGICLIMQRWREDDLVGYILEKEKDWEIVKIPAISDDGESFWDSRFPIPFLEEMRTNIGDYFFSSQYQQEPFVESGGDFKRDYFTYYTDQPKYIRKYMFIDPAISQKQEADYTAIAVIGITQDNHTYVLDVYRGRILPDEIIDKTLELAEIYEVNAIGIETIQYQKMLALELKKQMIARGKMYHIHEMKPTGEKEARIRATLQPRYSLGTVHHRNGGMNILELELELLKFPNAKNDDMIDALASCIAMSGIEYPIIQEIQKDNKEDPLGIFKEDDREEIEISFSPY